MSIQPASVWRQHNFSIANLDRFIGQVGTVVSATCCEVPPPGWQSPHWLAIVEFKSGKKVWRELLPITEVKDEVKIGDKVERVWRKLQKTANHELIVYGWKVKSVKG